MPDDSRNSSDVPAPHLRPTGPLRAQGDAYAHEEQGRQQNQSAAPMPEKSPLEAAIEQERSEFQKLQNNCRIMFQREQQKAVATASRAFDEKNVLQRTRIDRDIQKIEARREGGHGLFNRISGRVAQDEKRLQELEKENQDYRNRREESLAPLREQQRQDSAELEETLKHYQSEFDKMVEQARERGQFPEHERLTRGSRGPERGRDDQTM